jgi:hypothetical protein
MYRGLRERTGTVQPSGVVVPVVAMGISVDGATGLFPLPVTVRAGYGRKPRIDKAREDSWKAILRRSASSGRSLTC